MNRRKFLAASSTAVTIAAAGCLGGTDNEDLAENAAEVIDDELGLVPFGEDDPGWSIEGEQFFVDFRTSGDPDFDLRVVGGAYAGIVDDGFEYDAFVSAIERADDGTDTIIWDADIDRQWAQEFMNDDISEDEYIERIEATRS